MEIVLIKSYTDKPWRSPSTYRLIETSLQEKWTVHSINTQNLMTLFGFIRRLQWNHRNKIFVFNIAEYLDEKNRVGFLPSLLDEMEIPHLGSGARSVELGLDKAATKDLLSKHGVPTPSYFVVSSHQSDTSADTKRIGFPMIVKPVGEGGHIGIRKDSVVHDDINLNKITNRIFDKYNQPALVEEFISGSGMREFSVGIIDGEARLFTPIEIDYSAMDVEKKILSYEAAQHDLERTKLISDQKIRAEVIDLAEKTFDIVGARDYSRVDLRMDESGCFVLEINIMPGLGPHSFLPQAAKDIYGLEYNQLIHKMVKNSIQRQNLQARR
jgi:D-alanine-D-alanine ligase